MTPHIYLLPSLPLTYLSFLPSLLGLACAIMISTYEGGKYWMLRKKVPDGELPLSPSRPPSRPPPAVKSSDGSGGVAGGDKGGRKGGREGERASAVIQGRGEEKNLVR
jgi:hypothetical protein